MSLLLCGVLIGLLLRTGWQAVGAREEVHRERRRAEQAEGDLIAEKLRSNREIQTLRAKLKARETLPPAVATAPEPMTVDQFLNSVWDHATGGRRNEQ